MALDYNTTTGILAIIFSIVTAYFSYKIYLSNRLNKTWLAVTLAFVLVIVRRSIGFAITGNILPGLTDFLRITESTLLLAISALYLWGFWSMLKSFEDFDIVERKTKDKNQQFNNKNNKK